MGHSTCCVVNCTNTGINSKCKFYRFPTSIWKLGQRKQWIDAVNRKNADGSPWFPKRHNVICSDHFIGGKKSEEQASPSYVPTKFSPIYRTEKVLNRRILNNDSGDSKSRRKRKQDLSSVKSEQKPAKIVKIYPKIAPIEEVMIKEEPTNEPVEEVFIKQERFDEPIEEVVIKQERIDEHLEEKSIDAVENIVVKEERLDDYPTYSKAYDHLHSVIKTEQDDEEISQIPDQSL